MHPPHTLACEPPAGLLVLSDYLRRAGVATEVFDANLGTQLQLYSAHSLEQDHRQLVATAAPQPWITSAKRCRRRVPEALRALRRPETYRSHAVYRSALDALAEGCRSISRARGIQLTASDFSVPGRSPLCSTDLLQVFRQPAQLAIGDELKQQARSVLRAAPQLIGISAAYLSQALPAAALAGILRQLGYDRPIVLGGGLVTSWQQRLTPRSPLFHVWNHVVAGPGESALLALAQSRAGADTPGLLSPSCGAWNPPRGDHKPPVCHRTDPRGWPWSDYLAPGPILPLATCRGCYWRRCTYCPETAQDRQPLQVAAAPELAANIAAARAATGVQHIHLTDDAIPPATLVALTEHLHHADTAWYGFVRPEPQLAQPAVAAALARSGCRMLQLGIESASQRILDLLGKGTRADLAGPILRNLSRAGIRTYVYLLFGVPGETPAETRATIDWAAEHADHITFLNLALMNIPHYDAGEAPGQADLSLYRPEGNDDPRRRQRARRALAAAKAQPQLRPILARTPRGFGANHAAFAPLPEGTEPG